jgi:hypothetical protein
MSGGWPSQADGNAVACLGLDGQGPQAPRFKKMGVWAGVERRPFASPETGKKGSRRSVSIATPKAGRGTDCPRRGVHYRRARDRYPKG